MDKIAWCSKQKSGIVLIEPNDNLSTEYLKSSDNDIDAMENTKDKWQNITAYYACYEGLYAVMQKIGIKCEIHDCTIALMKVTGMFTEEQIKFIHELKDERINVQYYLKAPNPINFVKVKEFVLHCKEIISKLSEDDIKSIRENLLKKTAKKNSMQSAKSRI